MIKLLRKKIDSTQFEFTKHALDQTILRRITIEEVREAITDGEVIEDYPDDKYGPSCLVLAGQNQADPYICNAATRRVQQ